MIRTDEIEYGPRGRAWKALARDILDAPEGELLDAAEVLDSELLRDGENPAWLTCELIRLRVKIGLRLHGYIPSEKQGKLL